MHTCVCVACGGWGACVCECMQVCAYNNSYVMIMQSRSFKNFTIARSWKTYPEMSIHKLERHHSS